MNNEIIQKYTSSAPVKLGALASELGLMVFKSSLKPDISGVIEPCDQAQSGFRIRLNRHEKIERQRFTLAHEIAHFLLHRHDIGGGLVDDAMYRSSLSSRKEVEANKLASELIMPTNLVRKEREARAGLPADDLISELATVFRVSKQAMRIKLGY
jgi:Zn-dependent peptidase ImmA (M78 family)